MGQERPDRRQQGTASGLASSALADTALGGLQVAVDIFQDVAGDLGIPGLQTGAGALSAVLRLIQVHAYPVLGTSSEV